MSKFNNGGYVPSDMDFSEWVIYLNSHDENNNLDLKNFPEKTLNFQKNDFNLSVNQKDLSEIRKQADSLLKKIEKSISNYSNSDKLNFWQQQQNDIYSNLLFDYVKKYDVFESAFLFEHPSESFIEDEKKSQTFICLKKILNFKKFNIENKELLKALKFYDNVLKTENWAQKHSLTVEKWINSKAGNKDTVFFKILNAKIQLKKEALNQETKAKI